MSKFSSLCLGVLLLSPISYSSASTIVEGCTTTPAIYHEQFIPTNSNMSKADKRSAVLRSLGMSSSEESFATHNFKGQWFYERESESTIYAGYKVRTHYLSVAITYTDTGLSTILCDSLNLKQSKSSIHRKAPQWKGTLDSRIRIEEGKQSLILMNESSNDINANIKALDLLMKNNYINKEEYLKIKSRIK
ncbi:hypothetical protein A9264_02965 [Vibrio sp. UCD-FRSSP16_10]|uniref:hypothetical protein n=1 Tax=unclassified Vibrio TaxID=2614977 RepID=UPI0007FD9C7F|nr:MULTISPECIES: hypothetical protein [unclassified Vibrio]OBT12116.1 hypothetical protein A9260_04415 [Vibrio sp. UCD-FRSSP16_30]OBT20447.1 hypothetical protein A9264_02965 [Vibrio sp. UCD-FRSSP16_10]